MKIAYIIAPFETTEYLIRCINSIKRQTFSDYEIIVAENSFYNEKNLSEYIANTDKLKLITDKPENNIEKIREAVSLVSPASGLIKLITADTVVSPIAAAKAQCEGDIIIASCAEKSGDDYKITDNSPTPDNPKLSIYSMFLKKSIFEQLDDDVFTEKQAFELWLEEHIIGGTNIVNTGEISFYTSGKSMLQNSDPTAALIKNKDRILKVVKTTLEANSITMLDKYLSRLLTFLFDKKHEPSQKNDIFSLIKEMGEATKNSPSAKRLYELYLGEDTEFIQHFDGEGYLLYMDKKNAFSKASFYQSNLPKSSAPILSESKPDSITAELKAMRNEIAAISKNLHFVFNSSFAAGSAEFNDPVNRVPEMFSQGQLGLKVIIRSFKGWLKYKLSRKKK